MASVNPIRDISTLLGGSRMLDLGGEIASVEAILRLFQSEEHAAISASTAPKHSSDGGSILGTVLGGVEGFFGLGMNPLISGLAGLFGGGGGSSEPAPLVPYIAPPSVNVNAGFSASVPGIFAADTTDGGVPRPVPVSAANGRSAPQITVQVQALDSQSFLDHSNEIAMAVRQAMLESTTLNDVIREV